MADRIYIADKATLDAVKKDTTDLLGNFGAIKDIKGHKYKPVMSVDSDIIKSVFSYSNYLYYYKEPYIYCYYHDFNKHGQIQKYDLDLNLIADARISNDYIYSIFVGEKYIFIITQISRDGTTKDTLMKLDKNTLECIQYNDTIDRHHTGVLFADDNFVYYIDYSSSTIYLYKFDINTLQLSCSKTYYINSDYKINGITAQLENDYIYIGGSMENHNSGMDCIRRFNKNDLNFVDNTVSLCKNTANFILYKDYIFIYDGKLYYIKKDNFTVDKPIQLFSHITTFGKFHYVDEEYIYCGYNRIKISDTADIKDWEVESFQIFSEGVFSLICVKNQHAFSKKMESNTDYRLNKHKLIYNISHYEEVME